METKEWIRQFINTLAHCSDPCGGGIQRLSYTKAYREGSDYIRNIMSQLNLHVSEDYIGNILGILPGTNAKLPVILSGSHLDTVKCAGAYDGAAGIACALAVAKMIQSSQKPLQHSYGIIGTIEEEGGRFGQVLLGSQFLMGIYGKSQLDLFKDQEKGITLKEILKEYRTSKLLEQSPLISRDNILAFLELHGEQGPILEKGKIQAGIVKNIAGIRWLKIKITGETGHSGTVPMEDRHDAGIGAYKILLELNHIVTEQYRHHAVITAGQLQLKPGSANCIPGSCTFSLDIRSDSNIILEKIVKTVYSMENEIQRMGLTMEVIPLSQRDPVPMNPYLQKCLEKSCQKKGVSYLYMNSGAGHDSMIFSQFVPTAMLFLPNYKGISHHPDEYISPESLQTGAEILYDTIRMLDQE